MGRLRGRDRRRTGWRCWRRPSPPRRRDSAAGAAERTLALAVLRGALLDLLATGDADRAGAAVRRYLAGDR